MKLYDKPSVQLAGKKVPTSSFMDKDIREYTNKVSFLSTIHQFEMS